jgi:hypothetical protein
MQKRILLLLKPLIILTFIVFGFLYFLTRFQFGDNNSIIEAVSSPSGRYIAYVFIRNMGATTQESYQLSILEEGRKLGNLAGNSYISYSEFKVKWISEKELFVDNGEAEIFKQRNNTNGINITYNYKN